MRRHNNLLHHGAVARTIRQLLVIHRHTRIRCIRSITIIHHILALEDIILHHHCHKALLLLEDRKDTLDMAITCIRRATVTCHHLTITITLDMAHLRHFLLELIDRRHRIMHRLQEEMVLLPKMEMGVPILLQQKRALRLAVVKTCHLRQGIIHRMGTVSLLLLVEEAEGEDDSVAVAAEVVVTRALKHQLRQAQIVNCNKERHDISCARVPPPLQ